MQHLTIISRSKMDCQVYFDGKHQNLNTRFKREAELDAYIAKLLSEGWRLFNVDSGQMYLVFDQEESRPAAYRQPSGREKAPFVEESPAEQPLSWLTRTQPGRSDR